MIQLVSKKISLSTQQKLKELQDLVNVEMTFEQKVEKAQSLWKSKGGVAYREAFKEVKKMLTDMCVSVRICNYCEQDRANDIEHIAPKSFFPEFVFVWLNYLLACKQCNTGLKSDKCYVLDNNDDVQFVKRGTKPLFPTYAFINPRTENPNVFMMLNMKTYIFDIDDDLSKADKNKAEKTIEILELNTDAALIAGRKSAAKYYRRTIKEMISILNCSTKAELEDCLDDNDEFDFSKSLTEIKIEIKNSFKDDIQTHRHPSVWYAIKTVESVTNPNWKKLFAQIPEALNW